MTVREQGYEAIMVNCNPETVSTDYDVSDRLYFEPLTFEDVPTSSPTSGPRASSSSSAARRRSRSPTPSKTPASRSSALRRTRSTSPRTGAASASCSTSSRSSAPTTEWRAAATRRWPSRSASAIPCLVRPSYVLGGRAMEIVYGDEALNTYMDTAVQASPDHPVLIDKFLEDAIEVDVDCLCDGRRSTSAPIMQHVEEAGVHSGDSACVIPSISLGEGTLEEVRRQTRGAGPGARGQGSHERAVRLSRLRALRARGQPARLAHRAVRRQGDRRADGQAGDTHHPRRDARRTGPPHRRVPGT